MERPPIFEKILTVGHFVASRLAIRGWSEMPQDIQPASITYSEDNLIRGEE